MRTLTFYENLTNYSQEVARCWHVFQRCYNVVISIKLGRLNVRYDVVDAACTNTGNHCTGCDKNGLSDVMTVPVRSPPESHKHWI